MSRTFASPDCIARAAASMPARRSLTSSATSRADFVGDDGEPLTVLLGAGRLDRGVQRQQVGLAGDASDRLGEHADPLRHRRQPDDRGRRGPYLLAHRAQRLAGPLHSLPASRRRRDQSPCVHLHHLGTHPQRLRLVGGLGALATRAVRHRPLLAQVARQLLGGMRHRFRRGVQLLRRCRQLLGERRYFVRLPLHRRDRGADLVQHPIEALLEEPELVGLGRRGADGQEALLRLPHHTARQADPLDQHRRDLLEGHCHDDEHHRLQSDLRELPGVRRIQGCVQVTGAEVGEGGDQDEELADALPLVEGIRQHRNEQHHDQCAVAVPDDQQRHQHDVEQGEDVDQPPAVPAALVDHPHECVHDETRAEPRHHRRRLSAYHPHPPPHQPQEEDADRDPPAATVAAGEGVEVLQALLEPRGFVLPSA
jgi:hypothetical protein